MHAAHQNDSLPVCEYRPEDMVVLDRFCKLSPDILHRSGKLRCQVTTLSWWRGQPLIIWGRGRRKSRKKAIYFWYFLCPPPHIINGRPLTLKKTRGKFTVNYWTCLKNVAHVRQSNAFDNFYCDTLSCKDWCLQSPYKAALISSIFLSLYWTHKLKVIAPASQNSNFLWNK